MSLEQKFKPWTRPAQQTYIFLNAKVVDPVNGSILEGQTPSHLNMRQRYVCNEMLRRGFTSAGDCGGATLPLKEAINDGVFSDPRLFISGHALSQTGGHGDTRGPHNYSDCCGGIITRLGRICDGVIECLNRARDELRCGADFIKIMGGGGGGVASPTD
ncbi:hypothetical protein ACJ72_01346 [Emergomyces africanus]|uniref:Uncharacterized protein n=1 Tax=Emergomyces africanus TaxID=1955775 RepID=A0A1B7P5G5_9EURO|nr:hypothetical protein ACJ72_01346 [Emergomyces africanus]